MANLNEVRLIGRLTRDPELRSTSSGQPVASLSLATSRKFRGQDGTFREDTVFVDITCWGRLAETVSQYMRKGRQIYVGGRLKLDSWEDRQTGQKRSKLSVVAENVQFLDRKDDGMEGGRAYSNQTPYSSQAAQWSQPNVPSTSQWASASSVPQQEVPSSPQGAPLSPPSVAPQSEPPAAPPASASWDEPDLGDPPF